MSMGSSLNVLCRTQLGKQRILAPLWDKHIATVASTVSLPGKEATAGRFDKATQA